MSKKTLAILLILLGLAGLFFGLVGFNQKTAEINFGGVQASAVEKQKSPVMAVVGAILLVGGILVLVRDGGRS